MPSLIIVANNKQIHPSAPFCTRGPPGFIVFVFIFFSSPFFRTTRGPATCLRGSLCPPSQSLSTFGGFDARFLDFTPPYIVGRTTDDRRIVVYEDYAPSLRRLPVRPVGGPTLRRIYNTPTNQASIKFLLVSSYYLLSFRFLSSTHTRTRQANCGFDLIEKGPMFTLP